MDEPMTQFRAIPIAWGLSKEKYHRFLMWVAFRATFNGWGRCDALQVTFTVRDVSREFEVSTSTVSAWVMRAKDSGLLVPTNQSSKENGKGEVYGLGGEMLMTVKSAEQDPNNNRTSGEQVVCENKGIYPTTSNNNRTSGEQDPNVNRSTPDTPDTPTTTSPKKARLTRKQKVDNLSYPEAAVGVFRTLDAIWPTLVGDREVLWNGDLAASRITDILNSNPQITPDILIAAGKNYLDSLSKDKGGLKFVSALQFFFGPGKGGESPKWLREVRAINHAKTRSGTND